MIPQPLSRREFVTYSAASLALSTRSMPADDNQKPIRLGIIGLDTSHVSVFAKHFNRNDNNDPRQKDVRITAAFPAGNPDFPLSKNRLEGFTSEIRGMDVKIVTSIDDLLPQVDGVLLESVDGTQHLEQARPVFKAGKPLFIDKPLAASLKDVIAIAELARQHQVPWFTASSSRFTAGYPELRNSEKVGQILGCDTYSQSRAAIGHPDLFWYGVHGVDLLYSLMGTGCKSVTALQTPLSEQVTGIWHDGRVGTYRAIREHTGKTGLGATVFGSSGIVHVDKYYDYVPLVESIATFFRTRKSPIPEEEMVEVFSYLAAAEESKRHGGIPVLLQDVTAAARSA